MSKIDTIGWDIGGAHLKAVMLDQAGVVVDAVQLSCKLWLGLAELERAFQHVLARLVHADVQHAITMTGELVDGFENRTAGVQAIVKTTQAYLGARTLYYAGRRGFVPHSEVMRHSIDIASANWHASANLLSKLEANGLMVDIGSTTTDLIDIADEPIYDGYTDAERLQTGELLYTGVVRTPLMALAKKISFRGKSVNTVAEYFATTADVYLMTGELRTEQMSSDMADGGGTSMLDCARRLARMVGEDVDYSDLEDWKRLAQTYRQIQLNDLKMAIFQRFTAAFDTRPGALIGVGAGQFLVCALAKELKLPYVAVSASIHAKTPAIQAMAEVCFPAYAVASLLQMDTHVAH